MGDEHQAAGTREPWRAAWRDYLLRSLTLWVAVAICLIAVLFGARELGQAREERGPRSGMSARLPGGDLCGDVLAAVVLFGCVEVVG